MFRSAAKVFSDVLRFNHNRSLIQRSITNRYSTETPEGAVKLKSPTLEGMEKEYPENIVKIVDQVAALTLLEVADLNELLSKRLNIKAPTHSMSPMPVQQAASIKEETDSIEQAPAKTSYAVKLMKFDAAKKVALIKEIKNILPDMNLVQAKKFVETTYDVINYCSYTFRLRLVF
ncbi:hypothetical protein Aperf_G00000039393 [Anoplocephala perfoliata]